MKILAIDSSSAPASVAVLDDKSLLGEFTININRTHSEKLLPLVDGLLDAVNLSVSDIDAFAISAGPGSFTGLRIGMSAAKLMAQVSGKPLMVVSTLESLAVGIATFEGYICPMLDARNNTVFTAVYKFAHGRREEILAPCAMLVDELNTRLCELEDVMLTGEYIKYNAAFDETLLRAPEFLSTQRAAACGVIAYEKLQGGEVTYSNEVNPIYIRESQAEQARRAKEARNK